MPSYTDALSALQTSIDLLAQQFNDFTEELKIQREHDAATLERRFRSNSRASACTNNRGKHTKSTNAGNSTKQVYIF